MLRVPVRELLSSILALALLALAPGGAFAQGTGPGGAADLPLGALVQRGWALCAAERYKEAEPLLRRAVERDPNCQAAWANLGWAQAGMRRYRDAAASLDRALKLEPRDALAWSHLGFAVRSMGAAAESVEYYDRALQLDPEDIAAREDRKRASEIRR